MPQLASFDITFEPMVNVVAEVGDPKKLTEDEIEKLTRLAADKIADQFREKISGENLKEIKLYETKSKKQPKPLRTGWWHGNDATILCGRSRAPEVILVGTYTDEEARIIRRLVLKDLPLGEYENSVVYPDPEEWRGQNF